jgi:hypothetical protein
MRPPNGRLVYVGLIGLAGCVTTALKPEPQVQGKPAWVHSPGDGVSASAAFHVRGNQAQEDLAIARAREEFAKRFGVTVSSDHAITQRVANERLSTVSEKEIREAVRDKEVRAVVREKWKDPDSGVLWVWLVPAK